MQFEAVNSWRKYRHYTFDVGLSKGNKKQSGKGNKKQSYNKYDHIKCKNICTLKETINQTKRQPTEWGDIQMI